MLDPLGYTASKALEGIATAAQPPDVRSTDWKSSRLRPSSPWVVHPMPETQTSPYRTGAADTGAVLKVGWAVSAFVDCAISSYQVAPASNGLLEVLDPI